MRRRLTALATWADRNAAALLAAGGLAGWFAGWLLSPWPWLAGVLTGGPVFGAVAWSHVTGRFGADPGGG